MTMPTRLTTVLLLVIVLVAFQQVSEARQPQQPPERQEEFIPIDELPPQEQLPAAPLLVGAYAFVLLMLFGYMFTVSRRLVVIQSEVDRLDRELKRSGRN
jgi:hypothetical protein